MAIRNKCCPTCGQAWQGKPLAVDLTNNLVVAGEHTRKVNRRTAELLHLLVQAMPNEVPYDRLIYRLWGSNEIEWATTNLRVYASMGRRALEPEYTIRSCYGNGYRIEAMT